MQFTISASDPATQARTGVLLLPRGAVETPAFMPVGTLATVKGLTPRQLREVGADIVLANTYHLMLRPGADVVRHFGGVAHFMAWNRPVLTDSGGYQVFSLAHRRTITEEGVTFRSHIDGNKENLTPERAVQIQHCLNSDIMMALDVCPPLEANHLEIAESLTLTHDWADRCQREKSRLAEKESAPPPPAGQGQWLAPQAQSLFPIVQGGKHLDLRSQSAAQLGELDAPGYAIGGVSVGEGPEEMATVVAHTAPLLPDHKPRYLMGVGHPRDLLMGMREGIDLFDCVLPTRNGRNGQAFTREGPINLRNAIHRQSTSPIEVRCDCEACQNFTRGYLRHLFCSGEMLASQLTSLHNVRFLLRLMEEARIAIREGRYGSFACETARCFAGTEE